MRTVREFCYIAKGADTAPESGVKMLKAHSCDDATKWIVHGRGDEEPDNFAVYIAKGADTAPESGVKVEKFSSNENGAAIGVVRADTWGNEINNQKWQGAVS